MIDAQGLIGAGTTLEHDRTLRGVRLIHSGSVYEEALGHRGAPLLAVLTYIQFIIPDHAVVVHDDCRKITDAGHRLLRATLCIRLTWFFHR